MAATRRLEKNVQESGGEGQGAAAPIKKLDLKAAILKRDKALDNEQFVGDKPPARSSLSLGSQKNKSWLSVGGGISTGPATDTDTGERLPISTENISSKTISSVIERTREIVNFKIDYFYLKSLDFLNLANSFGLASNSELTSSVSDRVRDFLQGKGTAQGLIEGMRSDIGKYCTDEAQKKELFGKLDELEKMGTPVLLEEYRELNGLIGSNTQYRDTVYNPILKLIQEAKKRNEAYGVENWGKVLEDKQLWADIFKAIENGKDANGNPLPDDIRQKALSLAHDMQKKTIEYKEFVTVVDIITNRGRLEKKAAAEAALKILTGLDVADVGSRFFDACAKTLDAQFEPLEHALEEKSGVKFSAYYERGTGQTTDIGKNYIQASFVGRASLGKNIFLNGGLGILNAPFDVVLNENAKLAINPRAPIWLLRLGVSKVIDRTEILLATSSMAIPIDSIGLGKPGRPAEPQVLFVLPDFSLGPFKNIIPAGYLTLGVVHRTQARGLPPLEFRAQAEAFPRVGFIYYDANNQRIYLPDAPAAADVEKIRKSKAGLLGASVAAKIAAQAGEFEQRSFASLATIRYLPSSGFSEFELKMQSPSLFVGGPQLFAALRAEAINDFGKLLSAKGSGGIKWQTGPFEITGGTAFETNLRPGGFMRMGVRF